MGLHADAKSIFSLLRASRLEQCNYEHLTRELSARACRTFMCAESPVSVLLDVARGAMRTGEQMDRPVLLQRLAEKGLKVRPSASTDALEAAVRAASSQLREFPRSIGGVSIPRPAVQEALRWIRNGEFRSRPVAVLLDEAGSGKSAALSEVLNRLEEDGHVVLGIRLDSVEFTSPQELASALELPDSLPSVLEALVAEGRRVALLVDQLDALSSSGVGRDPRSLSVVIDVIARIASPKQVPVVLACRSFDWHLDARLRIVRDGNPLELRLPPLSVEEVDRVLCAIGVDPKALERRTIGAVRTPLRLRLLSEIIQSRRQEEPDWLPPLTVSWTLQRLYGALLDMKLAKARSEGLSEADCHAALVAVAGEMAARQMLAVATSRVASCRATMDWLCSEGLLVKTGLSVSFFHQTLFEFVYAEDFIRSGNRLKDFLLHSDQGLFFRPLTRQILEYERGVDRPACRRDVRELLEDPALRHHLRELARAWLGQLPDPDKEDMALIEPALGSSDGRVKVLRAGLGNPAWFDLLGPKRLISWLESWPSPELDALLWYLTTICQQRQAEVTGLLEPFLGRNEAWCARIAAVLARLDKAWSTPAANLLLRLVQDPHLTLDERGSWDLAIYSLGRAAPDLACPVIIAVLERCRPRWAILQATMATEPHWQAWRSAAGSLLPSAHGFTDAVEKAAEQQPAAFLEAVVPWMLWAMGIAYEPASARSFRVPPTFSELDHVTGDGPFARVVQAVRTAALELATSDPGAFRNAAAEMLAGGFSTMQAIVAEALLRRPADYAQDAGRFLTGDCRRLRVGEWTSPSWITAQLLRTYSASWDAETVSAVESAIQETAEVPPRKVEDLRYYGVAELELLQALDQEKLSTLGRARLDQLERKFPNHHQRPPMRSRSGWVGPPISAEAMAKMSDAAWLQAMRRYGQEADHTRRLRPIEQSGGPAELASALRGQAKFAPARFLRLAYKVEPVKVNRRYLVELISGLADGAVAVTAFEELVLKFLPILATVDFREVSWAAKKYASRGLPDSLRHLLETWAMDREHLDPTYEDVKAGRQPISGSSAWQNGSNTTRGAALGALATCLLEHQPPEAEHAFALLERLIDEPSPAVRAVALEHLAAAFSHDRARAHRLFRQLVADDRLLLREYPAIACVEQDLRLNGSAAVWAIDELLGDVGDEKARENGGALACLGALLFPEIMPVLDRCVAGDVPTWKGVAAVLARNSMVVSVGHICRERLLQLFNDPESAVREEACDFLDHLEPADLLDCAEFLRSWATSKALTEGAFRASRLLAMHPTTNPQLTLEISELILSKMGPGGGGYSREHDAVGFHLVPAILNVYREVANPDLRGRAMDLLDQAEALQWPDVARAYDWADGLKENSSS